VSTIAFCPWFELGHIQPTLRLAQELKAAGHRVVYWTLPDFQNRLELQGFETVALMPDRYPTGTIERLQRMPAAEHESRAVEICLAYRHLVLDGAFDELLRALAPDMLIADVLLHGLAIAARAQNILAYHSSALLPDDRVPGVPPFTTSLPYGDTPERHVAVEQAWHDLLARAPSELDLELARLDRQLLDKYGVSADAIEMRTLCCSLATVPELVLCASAFDFPRPASERFHYIESLSLERAPVEFPWDRLNPDKPLVFCSLGTQSYRIAGALRFYSEVVAAAASRPSWQFVIVLGSRWSASDFPSVPDNAILVPFAPQVQLLPRCSAVIHHGGLGTTKESIAFGVPMVVFPLLYDQPGNGVRIRYHGLGEVGDFHTVTAPALIEMLQRVSTDRELAERMATMRQAFADVERRQPGLALIEKALASR
jgi:zeaxanthin glucosyltransferase